MTSSRRASWLLTVGAHGPAMPMHRASHQANMPSSGDNPWAYLGRTVSTHREVR